MTREEIIEIVADIYEEYDISELGFDVIRLIKLMGINLIPYSSYEDKKSLLLHFDEDGFSMINPKNRKIEIYYNDKISPKERLKFTLPHELGHICLSHIIENGDETYSQKRDADLFARELYCPQALIISYGLTTVSDLISTFGITASYAEVLLIKLEKRHDTDLSEAERRLLEIFETNKKKQI